MAFIAFRIFGRLFFFVVVYALKAGINKVQAVIHRCTYQSRPNPRTVLIIGGSYAGAILAQRLVHCLPSGYRVVMLEKHSHLHHAFAFPRFSVVGGLERTAFVPYTNLAAKAPTGIFEHIQGLAKQVEDGMVILADGTKVEYDCLVIATGSAQPAPTRLIADNMADGIRELKGYQQRIEQAQKVAIVGGGAAGVELATDVRHKYPQKQVTLIHSRQQLLPRFGWKLHRHVAEALERMNIQVILGERPVLPTHAGLEVKQSTLKFSSGEERSFDLVIPCTGLRPQSDILYTTSPNSIAPDGEILVNSYLEVQNARSIHPLFALGDVAKSGGPKQARACLMQADVVATNIIRRIKGHRKLKTYTPRSFENALALTLGKEGVLHYIQDGDLEWMHQSSKLSEDVEASRLWKMMNARPDESD